ncbi:glutaredoxin family protein [Variovorax dokdonensis]|uniref:Glutaredoxin family protein n=1 Tax=Variovorax dokdonensis TaxID=344883 RepID=A0ABT7N7Z6_9BURK|nr:glutaredoxin family protein [Variovorax dokdonensis]MDM0044066.1 glutaredoxin family protein [Variovorax dokdonensis]
MPCTTLSQFPRLWRGPLLLGAAALCLVGGPVGAQVYRQIDANGRVTFSDKPPTSQGSGAQPVPSNAAPSAANGLAQLPYELRQVAQRYPVTLYTRSECQPCDAGRNLLTTRGVPYTERTVNTPEDNAALSRQTGQSGLPMLTIGSQRLEGFLDSEWSQYLDAAGYPASSQLPSGYRQPAAAPLVAVAPAPAAVPAPAAASAPAAPPSAPAPVQGPTPDNPAGIRF